MNVTNRWKIIFFIAIIVTNLNANLIGSIGFVSPQYPKLGNNRLPADLKDFFDDFIDTSYDCYGDAGISVANKLNMKRGEITFKDIKYENHYLVPSEENMEAIEKFYSNKSVAFHKDIAKKNRVDIILYSKINKGKFRKIMKKRENTVQLVYMVYVYDLQSNARIGKSIKIKVTDFFTSPDYDIDELQSLFTMKYIKIFQKLLGHMKMIGSAYKTSNVNKNNNTTTKDTGRDNNQGDW